MAIYKSNIYEIYKPLRNHLRKCGIIDSLRVIWYYAQNLQFNGEFPEDIDVSREYLQRDHIKRTTWISEWHLAILTKEVLIHSAKSNRNKNTFREWKYLSAAINKIKNIENKISQEHIDTSNILREVERMAHGQFAWQIDRPNKTLLARYYKLYDTPEMNAVIKSSLGLTTKELFFVSFALLAVFLENYVLYYPFNIEIKGLDQESIDKVLKFISSGFPALKEKLISEQNINENYVYAYSSLRSYPIIRMEYEGKFGLFCPVPTLLFWRITIGLYYEVVNQKDFDNAFGASFQNHIGDCISISNTNPDIKVYPEKSFMDGNNRKDTVDWILDDGNSIIFIECKSKRMTMPSKTELVVPDALEKDREKMASFVSQVYKTIRDYRNGKYPTCKYDEKKKIYPLVITLEDWHLFGDNSWLKKEIEKKLKAEDIPITWLSEMPYTICSANEFEAMIQIIQSTGIDAIIGRKLDDPETASWEMAPFLLNIYPKEHGKIKNLFPEIFNSIFPEELLRESSKWQPSQ